MSVTPINCYFFVFPNNVIAIATAVPSETPSMIMVARASAGGFGIRRRIEDEYQKATAKDTIRTAALINERMKFIRPLRTMRNIAVALPPSAITKMTALRLAELKESPWKGVTWAGGTTWFEIGYPRRPVTARLRITG